MSLSYAPTVDELLADGLIQVVMQADHVESNELRTLLNGAAGRIARRRESVTRPAETLLAWPSVDRRPTSGRATAPARVRPALLADPCGSALCC
jgi:hypothetical protein